MPVTERLLLRQWEDADRAPLAALNADPEVMRHFPAPLSRVASDALVDRWRDGIAGRGWGLWAVEVRATGDLVGMVGPNQPQWTAAFTRPQAPCTEVGWRLARSAWGPGYASEAAREAARVAFDEVGIDEVVSFTTVGNLRSRAVMARLGTSRDPGEDFDHPRIAEGSPHRRHVLYRLPRGSWLRSVTDAGDVGGEADTVDLKPERDGLPRGEPSERVVKIGCSEPSTRTKVDLSEPLGPG